MNNKFIVLTLLMGLIILPCISATEFDTFTIQTAGLLKLFMVLVGLVIIMLAVKVYFEGGPSFLRFIVITSYVGVAILIVLIFIPIVVNHIATTVG